MTTGRTPPPGARTRPGRPPGGSLQANLPYLVVIVVCLVVLVGFIAVADPFGGGAASAVETTLPVAGGESTTTTAAAATTTTVPGTATSADGLTAAARGEAVFNGTCIACHGVGGVGVEGLGKPLTTSTFAAGLTDDELLAFLIVGRLDTDPLNTTGMAMPARGGNASLTDDDLRDVVAYLRTLAA